MKKSLHTIAALAIAITACAPAATASRGGPVPTPESRIYDAKAKQFITMQQLVNQLAQADVVFFGEQHDDNATHRAELAYLAAIGATKPNVVTSMEMFERDAQPALSSYLAGMTPESVFLAMSRPWPRYTTDYRGIVELSRAHGWPVIAANVPRRLASAVSHAGLAVLDTVSKTDRSYVATDIQCPHDKYYERFAEEMTGHAAGGADDASKATTKRFYEAQCIKDETMAESIVNALDRAGSNAVVVHFNGAFHSDMGLGTAARVKRRRPGARTVVISAMPVDNPSTADASQFAALGDYILLTPKGNK